MVAASSILVLLPGSFSAPSLAPHPLASCEMDPGRESRTASASNRTQLLMHPTFFHSFCTVCDCDGDGDGDI